ncbi:hypothetical protein CMT52_17900 [Elizabethkingia anophelis]|nr:hypothetical protein [Elizabethkingia anophelis]
MKKILSILLLSFSLLSFSQFKVVGSSNEWSLIGKGNNAIKLYQNDSMAKIEYIDYGTSITRTNVLSPTTAYEFKFSAKQDDLNKLYDLIIEKYNARKVEEITLEFPEGNMYLNFYKDIMGSFGFNFKFDNKTEIIDKNSIGSKRQTYALNIKQINKLFGKTK